MSGRAGAPIYANRWSDADVRDRCPPGAHDHPTRLEVVMENSVRVSEGDRVGDTSHHENRFGHGQLSLAREPRPERFTFHRDRYVVHHALG